MVFVDEEELLLIDTLETRVDEEVDDVLELVESIDVLELLVTSTCKAFASCNIEVSYARL